MQERLFILVSMERNKIINKIKKILLKEGIQRAYFFGSFARGEKVYNDIDIAIVPPKSSFSLLDVVHLQNILENEIGKKIDIVTLRSIDPKLKPYIQKELVEVK